MTSVAQKPVAHGYLFSLFIGLPLLCIAAVLSIPYGLIYGLCLCYSEHRLRGRLQARRRTLPWREVESHLHAGTGTLIVERANKHRDRFWWTLDDVVSASPVAQPAFDELAFMRPDPTEPFLAWVSTHYLSLSSGAAFLTPVVRRHRPADFFETDSLRRAYPAARVIMVPLTPK